ncbi:MAG: hypothetical protein ABJB12_17320, partial [Pseudomonadota bacterium]
MKFPLLVLAPSVTFFALNALAQDVPASAPPAPADQTAAAGDLPPVAPALPPAAAPTAPPDLVAPLPPAAPSNAALGNDGNPLAGWHNGVFYLRDSSDNFRLYLQGRAQVDFYSYAGPGVADVATLKPTLFLRRIRPEIGGEFFHNWWFSIAGDFG